MFSLKSYVLYLLLSLVGYLGRHHHGLTQAKETQALSSAPIKTPLNVQVKNSSKIYDHQRDIASEAAAASSKTEAIYSTFYVSTAQIAILETATALSQSENSKQLRTTKPSVTPHAYSLASHVVSAIMVLPGTSRVHPRVQPSRVLVLFSRNFTDIFPSNSTTYPHGRKNSTIDDCSAGNVGEKSCDTYVTRWVDFYLNVSVSTKHV